MAYAALAAGASRLAEPYLVPMLPTILDKCSDKVCAESCAGRHELHHECLTSKLAFDSRLALLPYCRAQCTAVVF